MRRATKIQLSITWSTLKFSGHDDLNTSLPILIAKYPREISRSCHHLQEASIQSLPTKNTHVIHPDQLQTSPSLTKFTHHPFSPHHHRPSSLRLASKHSSQPANSSSKPAHPERGRSPAIAKNDRRNAKLTRQHQMQQMSQVLVYASTAHPNSKTCQAPGSRCVQKQSISLAGHVAGWVHKRSLPPSLRILVPRCTT